MLRTGLDARLFSGAAAGVRTKTERIVQVGGTHQFDHAQAVSTDSRFDLASLTKSYVAAAALVLVDRGDLELDVPVAGILPIGTGDDADRITLRMLLAHTSGLPPTSEAWREPATAEAERLPAILASSLATPPGTRFGYSCLGYIAAGALIETVTAASLPQVVHDTVLAPLGLHRTSFGPIPALEAVATEYEPYVGRGLVRGEVHDELSWYLGGRTGNAGLFAPVDEVLRFAESLLRPGLLSDRALREMTRSSLAPHHRAGFGHGLGARIGDVATMGTPRAYGHTGFTGTLWLADADEGWAAALLTNRVHPDRESVRIAPFRRLFVDSIRPFL